MIDDAMLDEFKIEAAEMFESSEDGFLKIECGDDFISNFNLIFRAFHSLKGAAGMFGLLDLQSHMHKLESLFEAQRAVGHLDKEQIDYFLKGIDVAKILIDGSYSGTFHYYTIDEFSDMGKKNAAKALTSPSPSPSAKTGMTKPAPTPQKAKAPPIVVTMKPKDPPPPAAVKPAEVKPAAAVAPKTVASTPVSKSTRGLFYVIDDEEDIVDLLKSSIEELNFEVKGFTDAEDALDLIEEDNPDVIISDYNMPKFDGLKMITKLRDQGIDVPVIFVSGFLSKEIIFKMLEQGAFGFIEKPYSDEYLQNICESSFRKTQAVKLLQKSINYILYQFSDLDQYLKEQGKESIRLSLKSELQMILAQQKILKGK